MKNRDSTFTDEEVEKAFQRVRKRSRGVTEEVLAEEGGSLDDTSFAAEAGCTPSDLLDRSAVHQAFFVEHDGRRYWPRWQLGLPGLHEILATLAKKGAHGFSIACFFLQKTDVLYFSSADPNRERVRKSDSPLKLLRRVREAGVQLVVQHADRFGEHGAL